MKPKTWLNQKQVVEAVGQASVPRLMKAGLTVEAIAKSSMRVGGRSVGVRGGEKQTPSKPGTPPNVQTGVLRASIETAPTSYGTVVVGPTLQAWYGRIHEFGKRPFMRPALVTSKTKFPALFSGLKIASTPAGRELNRAEGQLPQ